jgi:hypothetical protein
MRAHVTVAASKSTVGVLSGRRGDPTAAATCSPHPKGALTDDSSGLPSAISSNPDALQRWRGADAMSRCSAGPSGRCQIDCVGGCACAYVWEDDTCTCECFDSVGGGPNLGLNAQNVVDVSITGLPLGHVATFFDGLLARDVLVPASRLQEKVTLKLKRVTLSHALKELGLSTQKPVAQKPVARRKPAARSKRTP